MGDRGAAVRRAASPAAEEAPKKQKVGDTGHVRNANDVHTNGHVKNICLPTDYELNRYDKLYNKRWLSNLIVFLHWSKNWTTA